MMEESAIFIADSHFKQDDTELLEFFLNIPKGRQVFLMGDIFHLLIGSINESCIHNMKLINAIALLTHTNQIIFLEGNHDFDIKNIWNRYNININKQNLHIFSYIEQPIILKDNKNNLFILAHGDLWIGKKYYIYRNFINNSLLLLFFRYIDKLSCGIIYKKIYMRICKKMIAEFSFFRTDYEIFMHKRIEKYNNFVIDILVKNGIAKNVSSFCIIEGHYHLGKSYYKNNIAYNALKSCYFYKEYLTFKKDKLLIEVKNG